MAKRIYFTVTNDLSFDQRMHRICGSLAEAGYHITLVGRKLPGSRPLENRPFRQRRLNCLFKKGPAFYAEYNIRLFLFLLTHKMDAVCAIDLDTILPALVISKWKRVHRVYDAHEYFTELKEVQSRPRIQKVWKWVEKVAVPRFRFGYTVSEGLATAFAASYGSRYEVIRNMPVLDVSGTPSDRDNFLVYQGAVNEGRCFEYLIPAMKEVPYRLVVCGDGNYMNKLKASIREQGVEANVELKGMLLPSELRVIAKKGALGLALAEKEGLNQYMALPNKFFDYMHAGLPQITMNYPEYRKINEQYEVAVLIDDLSPRSIAGVIRKVMEDKELRTRLEKNCEEARKVFCWQKEKEKLLSFYQSVFSS